MEQGLTLTLWILAALLLGPILVFCGQCWATLLPGRRPRAGSSSARPRVAVLIPAHNERQLLPETLAALRPQLGAEDQVLVVADNCTDDTAAVARAAGAAVVERHEPDRRGKGYALSTGLAALENYRYEVLLVLDADCRIEPGAVDALAMQVATSGLPAQAVYLMEQCDSPTPRDSVSSWAFMVKNQVRPTGLARLGFPCQLTGTGMAFPRTSLDHVSLASGNIVEDMQLGLDLALAGYAPRLCREAHVTGRLPADGNVALKQRRRWEHGHLRTLLVQAPRLLVLGLVKLRLGAVIMAIDLLVPPLSLLVLLAVGVLFIATGTAALTNARWEPAMAMAIGIAALIATVLVAWVKFGRECLPARSLFAAAGYIAWKIPMYAMFLIKPERKWVRTDRGRPLPVDPAKSAA